MNNPLVITTSILNFMFFISGVDKFLNYSKVVGGLERRLNFAFPAYVYKLMIFFAILIELLCPAIIMHSAMNRNVRNDKRAFYCSVLLIIFTIFATLIYHFPPTTSAKYYPFMSNLSLVGGLSLMALVFYRNALF